jgi:hypothetical protein
VRDRRFVWSNERVQELMEKFIPVAEDWTQINRKGGAGAEVFKNLAHGAPQVLGCVTPTGKRLSSMDDYGGAMQGPGPTIKAMEVALEAWEKEAHPDGKKAEPAKAKAPVRRPERRPVRPVIPAAAQPPAYVLPPCPAEGMVLRFYCRDLPGRYDTDMWNLDNLVLEKADRAALVPSSPEVGSVGPVSEPLARRILRGTLVDSVRDPAWEYEDKEVQKAVLSAKVTASSVGILSIRYEGEARMASKDRGYEGKLLGFAKYDLRRDRFLSLDIVAIGSSWGGFGMHHHYRNGNDPFPLGVVLSLRKEREEEPGARPENE